MVHCERPGLVFQRGGRHHSDDHCPWWIVCPIRHRKRVGLFSCWWTMWVTCEVREGGRALKSVFQHPRMYSVSAFPVPLKKKPQLLHFMDLTWILKPKRLGWVWIQMGTLVPYRNAPHICALTGISIWCSHLINLFICLSIFLFGIWKWASGYKTFLQKWKDSTYPLSLVHKVLQ